MRGLPGVSEVAGNAVCGKPARKKGWRAGCRVCQIRISPGPENERAGGVVDLPRILPQLL